MLRKIKFYRLLRVCGVGSAARQKERGGGLHIITSSLLLPTRGNITGKGEGEIFAF